MNTLDNQLFMMASLFIIAALPSCIYLTFRLRNTLNSLREDTTDLHVRIREALYVNDQRVKQLQEAGIEVEESPEEFNAPNFQDDLNNIDGVIMQVADSKKDKKNHLKQLKRLLKDTEETARNRGILDSLFWVNLAMLFIAVIALIGTMLAALASGGGLIAIVIAAILLLIDIIAKIIGAGLSENNRKRAERLKQEMKDKEKKLGTT